MAPRADPDDITCVTLTIGSRTAPAIVTEIAPPHRLRVLQHGEPRLLAAGSAERWGVVALVLRPFDVLPRFTAAGCRSVRDTHPGEAAWWTAWAVRFANALRASGSLGSGTWVLDRAEIGARPLPVPFVRDGVALLPVDDDADRAAGKAILDLDWSMPGENAWLAMRALGPADDGRRAAAVKLALDATLPPALLWWHSGLQAHLVLDGHVRIAAFRAAGNPIRALVLRQERTLAEDPVYEHRRTERITELERHIADPVVLAREISRMYADEPRVDHRTTARLLTGGRPAWDGQAAALSPDYARSAARLLAD